VYIGIFLKECKIIVSRHPFLDLDKIKEWEIQKELVLTGVCRNTYFTN